MPKGSQEYSSIACCSEFNTFIPSDSETPPIAIETEQTNCHHLSMETIRRFIKKSTKKRGLEKKGSDPKNTSPRPSRNPTPALPPEIWCQILSNLSGRKDLLAALHVNRLFQGFSEPLLYRQVSFSWSRHERPIHLLRTLATRPELGEYVQVVRLYTPPHDPYSRWLSLKPLNSFEWSDVDRYLDAAWPKSGPLSDPLWLNRLRTTETHIWGGLLLAWTPNVEHLQIGPEGLDPILATISRSVDSSTLPLPIPSFRRLQKLSIDRPGPESRLEPENVFAVRTSQATSTMRNISQILSTTPTLRKYKGPAPIGLLSCLVSMQKSMDSLPFTKLTLYLHHSDHVLEEFLSLTPSLTDFAYIHMWLPEPTTFECSSLFAAVYRIRESVEWLKLTERRNESALSKAVIDSRSTWLAASTEIHGDFGSLREFLRLKTLIIPWVLLTERNTHALNANGLGDILPPNLETLVIDDFLADCVVHPSNWGALASRRESQFERFLVESRASSTPCLRKITIKGGYEFWDGGHTARMTEMCEAAGIRVKFI
ncbi:F-box protein [Aspergillus lucknowensis]|uniref:F-box domain-containing protein n=1 Tax=Aspergillus lucknowensis TaxID=176173 RepID=A0ABR4M544_9EURO